MGMAFFTSFTHPRVFAADAADNLYVWDAGNYLVRRINQNADVTTIAGIGSYSRNGDVDGVGQSAAINYVATMCADNWGNILMCCGTSIRKMSAQLGVTTLAGSFGVTSFANGAGALARFNDASGVCFSNGKVFVADKLNQRVRVITFNPQPELLTGADLSLGTYAGLRITGFVGRTYRIESSPDMTNWTTRASVLLTATPYLWFDENPVNGSKYYRAFLLP